MGDGGIMSSGRVASWSSWCRDIVNLRPSWFCHNIEKKFEDGSFWEGVWARESSLKSQFPRLYNLSVDKNVVSSLWGNG